jgi:hypothetical protein
MGNGRITSGCYGLVTVGTISALLRSVKGANCNQPQSQALASEKDEKESKVALLKL